MWRFAFSIFHVWWCCWRFGDMDCKLWFQRRFVACMCVCVRSLPVGKCQKGRHASWQIGQIPKAFPTRNSSTKSSLHVWPSVFLMKIGQKKRGGHWRFHVFGNLLGMTYILCARPLFATGFALTYFLMICWYTSCFSDRTYRCAFESPAQKLNKFWAGCG